MLSIIDEYLSAISRRVKVLIRADMEEKNEKDILNSWVTQVSTLNVLSEGLQTEISNLLEELAKTKLSRRQVKKLRRSVHGTIEQAFIDHIDDLKSRNLLSIEDYNTIASKLESEVKAVIDIKIGIIDKILYDKRMKIYAEIARMVLSAIIGGLIGAGIKILIG